MMGNVVFRCPATGVNVQYRVDDDPDVSDNEYEGVMCPSICSTERLASQYAGMK
jgi:hypothetical protein